MGMALPTSACSTIVCGSSLTIPVGFTNSSDLGLRLQPLSSDVGNIVPLRRMHSAERVWVRAGLGAYPAAQPTGNLEAAGACGTRSGRRRSGSSCELYRRPDSKGAVCFSPFDTLRFSCGHRTDSKRGVDSTFRRN